jgi:hypothetical protein
VTIISRDRSGLYAEGARVGAPDALQVADRFHLLLNLSTAIERALEEHTAKLKLPAKSQTAEPEERNNSLTALQTRQATPAASIGTLRAGCKVASARALTTGDQPGPPDSEKDNPAMAASRRVP